MSDLATLWTEMVSERLKRYVRCSFPWEKPVILKAVAPYFHLGFFCVFFSTFHSLTKILFFFPSLHHVIPEKSFHWAPDHFPVFSIEELTSVGSDRQSKVQSSKLKFTEGFFFSQKPCIFFHPWVSGQNRLPFQQFQNSPTAFFFFWRDSVNRFLQILANILALPLTGLLSTLPP